MLPPTAAPWAKKNSAPDISNAPLPGRTGRPVPPIIKAESTIPSTSLENHQFVTPKSLITSEAELRQFLESETVKSFVGFILAASDSVRGHKNSDTFNVSESIEKLLEMLRTLSSWVTEFPPVKQSLRYGNPAYKQWFAKAQEKSQELVSRVLPQTLQSASKELASYLLHSLGNSTRIDYGTGHETTFCAFLYCLTALGVLKSNDLQAMVSVVFNGYIELMQKVQTTYWLEPAGSHGVWGLDDYQFLTFVWGSSQLIDHPSVQPSSIHANMVLEDNWEEYMYINSIKFVKKVKKGSLHETSPMLSDISNVPSWNKVNSGLMKMYQVEVLSKLPIMQHFLFGSILRWDR